jgi:hypothetical protein
MRFINDCFPKPQTHMSTVPLNRDHDVPDQKRLRRSVATIHVLRFVA